MIRDELRARLALRALPGTRDEALLELLARHDTAVAALAAVSGGSDGGARRALQDARFLRKIEYAARRISMLGVRVLLAGEPDFPPLPAPIAPPPVLCARGDLELLKRRCAAVVGTRRSTEYGEDVADELGTALAQAGVPVISGLARGIDGVAHRAALAAGGTTIAVLGNGIDVTYPREHAALQEEIAAAGLLLSEFVPGDPPLPHHFLQRNRLIAGLAAVTVVVEGGARSGAINTATHALAANCDIFAVPGPLGRGTSDGPLALLRDGAQVYTSPVDVLVALGISPAREAASGATLPPPALPASRRQRLLDTGLRRTARHVDAIAAAIGESAATTLAGLLELELEGKVQQLPGMHFRIAPKPRWRAENAATARDRSATVTAPAERGTTRP
jgi:DNA processing protein